MYSFGLRRHANVGIRIAYRDEVTDVRQEEVHQRGVEVSAPFRFDVRENPCLRPGLLVGTATAEGIEHVGQCNDAAKQVNLVPGP